MLQQALDSGGRIAGNNAEIPESKPSISNGRGPAFPNAGQVQGSMLATSAANADVALSARRLSPGAEEVVSNNVSAAREGGPAGGTSGIDSVRQRHEPQVRRRCLFSILTSRGLKICAEDCAYAEIACGQPSCDVCWLL